jgi:hypothetical protein
MLRELDDWRRIEMGGRSVLQAGLTLGEMDVATGHRDVPMAQQPLNLGKREAGNDGSGADRMPETMELT